MKRSVPGGSLRRLGNRVMSQASIEPIPSTRPGAASHCEAWRAIAVCGLLFVAVVLVYSRTLSQGFSNFDDGIYVQSEPHVSGGFSWSGIVWALTDGPGGRLVSALGAFPHARLSTLWPEPAGHHLTNVLLHAASAVLLFLVLWRMTAAFWPSALVAALFALHPLRVESVAWIAERRDVLSGLFFMLTLWAYERLCPPSAIAGALPGRGRAVGFGPDGQVDPGNDAGVAAAARLLALGRLSGISSEGTATNSGGDHPPARSPAPFPWRVVGKRCRSWRWPWPRPASP